MNAQRRPSPSVAALRRCLRFHAEVDGIALRGCWIAFDALRFAPSDFAQLGIACPPALAASPPMRQASYCFGRLAARQADPECRDLSKAPGGAPVWPTAITGSLTHAGGHAVAALTRDRRCGGLGIDLEAVIGTSDRDALIDRVVDAQEQRLLRHTLPAWSTEAQLTLAFSAKESFFKAAHAEVGRRFGFDAVRLTQCDPQARTLTLTMTEALAPALPVDLDCRVAYRARPAAWIFTAAVWRPAASAPRRFT